MSFYSAASNNSLWRGVEYYTQGNVESFAGSEDGHIKGFVRGSDDISYDVEIDLEHPKKSTCTCPFAEGRRVICKHMIALYFTSVPGSYENFEADMRRLEVQYELEEEKWRQETLQRIRKRVKELSAKQAKAELIEMLYQNALDDRYQDERDYW